MIKQNNIFLIGPMGAGKSTIGKLLSKQLKMKFIDSDQEIEKRAGANIEWIFDVEGENGFRNREKKIINELTQKEKIVLATGGGCVISDDIRSMISSRGLVIYLKISIDKQLYRMQRDKKRPLLKTEKVSRDILEKLSLLRNPLYEEIANISISTEDRNIRSVVSEIINNLKKNQNLASL